MRGQRWELARASLDRLLAALDPDRQKASQEYERLRTRLVRFFAIHGFPAGEDLADEAFDRLARRLADGAEIQNAATYLIGIARILVLESRTKQKLEQAALGSVIWQPATDGLHERRVEAVEHCLETLTAKVRGLVYRYYSEEARSRIDTRKEMAAELGISLNALRNRMLRLRGWLEACLRARLSGNEIKPPDSTE